MLFSLSNQRNQAVLFDLDGTLVDSMGMWGDIDRIFMADRKLPLPKDLQLSIAGMSMYETAVYFKENFHLKDKPEELMAIWNDMAREEYRYKIPLKPGALDFLKCLKDQGIPMGLATSNSMDLVSACFEKTGLDQYMDAVISADQVKNGKPAPDVYLTCAKELGQNPANCTVFEDVLQGVQAGVNAGMRVIAVDDPVSREHLDEKKALAVGVIHDFKDLEVVK
ncbi:MAG: HAD family phosphatase [Lachnospiraceae bacterium]|jgi:HAD superfamily hydrolase (TIGR01509 family)|nr:HAD family phosphatase [Lachnospiraceae bacterium]